MTTVSALAIDGAAMMIAPSAAITYPSLFIPVLLNRSRIEHQIAGNVPAELQEISECLFRHSWLRGGCLRRMGRAQRNPSATNAGVDGFRYALPILLTACPLGTSGAFIYFAWDDARPACELPKPGASSAP